MNDRAWAKGEACGRIDFLGGVADYSGAWVLEVPICAKTTVKVRAAAGPGCSVISGQEGKFELLQAAWTEFQAATCLRSAREALDRAEVPSWGRYVLGCIAVLLHHRKCSLELRGPLDFEIDSKMPLGMGVSSSAGIEVATLRALTAFFSLSWSGTELARLAQQVENEIVGAPCGLMDQLTAAHGKPRALLPILCRPDYLGEPIKLPPGVTIAGWPSGVKHRVGASPYAAARCAAFMGKKILECELKRTFGYLAEVRVSEFVKVSSRLPRTIRGREFALMYGDHADPLTRLPDPSDDIDPWGTEAEILNRAYPVRPAARFPIEETFRVEIAQELLRAAQRQTPSSARRKSTLELVGELLLESHVGYSRMGLGSSETDAMVAAVVDLGPAHGFYGARISGGGSGGTVVVLLEETSLPRLEALRLKFGTPHPVIVV